MRVIPPSRKTLPRAAAFAAQGVALKYPADSWSGVRSDDGMVIFAVRAEEVIADSQGSRCLLWAPAFRSADFLMREERLEHCIRAVRHGQAEGLLAFAGGAEVDPGFVLSLRVERHCREYWAKWGSAGWMLQPWLGPASRWLGEPQYALAAANRASP